MNVFKKMFVVMASRVLASLIAGVAAWAFSKYAITIPDETQRELVNQAIAALTIALATFGAGHKAIDSKLNPGDSANHILAVEQKRQSVQMTAINEINGAQ